jgi:hypothetical protein
MIRGLPVPEVVKVGCENARTLTRVCDILEGLGGAALQDGSVGAVAYIEDPTERPYLWDLQEED